MTKLSPVAIATALAVVPLCLAAHVRHERREDASGWIKREALNADFVLPMRIGLAQNNLHLGHDMLMDVSDPDSPKYGHHWSSQEVHDFFAPSNDAVDAVRAWLAETGIAKGVSQSANKQWLQFDAPASKAEELLKTKFHIYEHSLTGKESVGCDEYHVKDDVQHHIDYITPGIKMLGTRTKRALAKRLPKGYEQPGATPLLGVTLDALEAAVKALSLDLCDVAITPNCIQAMYNISTSTTNHTGNELGIFEEGEFLDFTDMRLFFTTLAPNIPSDTFPIVHGIDGAENENGTLDGRLESSLDFQISYPLIYPQQSILFLTDDFNYATSDEFNGLFNNFLDAIDGSYCNFTAFGETGNNNTVDPTYPDPNGFQGQLQCGVFKPTNVISLSYELAEFNEGTAKNYQQRQCSEYMKLGLQGTTVVFSSGDHGVGSSWGCAGNDSNIFNPGFPSNCPYVTSVGGTTLTGKPKADEEVAMNISQSGGGFSNYFPQPSYQSSAVEAYFKTPQAPTFPSYTGSDVGNGHFNRSGRAFPDISAVGQNIVIFVMGVPMLGTGTSASAPVVASIFTRINEKRLAAGKKPIGFANPTLYKNPQAFNDITVGDNNQCGPDGDLGFNAAAGWDPVTGLGTPNYPALLKAFMKNP